MIAVFPSDFASEDLQPFLAAAAKLKIEVELNAITVNEMTLDEAICTELEDNPDHPVILLSGPETWAWAGLKTITNKSLGFSYWYSCVRLITIPLMTEILYRPAKFIDLMEALRNAVLFPVECPVNVDIMDDKPRLEPWMDEVKTEIRRIIRRGGRFTKEELDVISAHVPMNLWTPLKKTPKVLYVTTQSSPSLIEQMFLDIFEAKNVAIDLETNGYSPFTNGILCIAIGTSTNNAYIIAADLLQSDDFCTRLRHLFTKEDINWVCHNAKFDCRFLLNHRRIKACPKVKHDTMIMHYVLDERLGTHGLKQLACSKLGAPDYEGYVHALIPSQETSYQYVPRRVLFEYAALDVCYTLALLERMQQELSQGDPCLQEIYSFLVEATNAFVEIENNGILVDKEAVHAAIESFGKEISERYALLAELVGPEFNPRSPKQVASYLYDACQMQEIRLFRNHKPRSTSREALDKLAAIYPDNKFLKLLTDIRSLEKLLSTYVHPILEKVNPYNGRLYTDFKLHGTVTGRLASSKPNLQNVPRTTKNKWAAVIRNFFVAGEGRTIVGCDYKGAELRVATCFAEEPVWRDAFLHDRDLHAEVCLKIFGPGWTKENRMIAKMLNFGLLYGRGASSIATERNMTQDAAQAIVRSYFEAVPMIAKHLQWIKNETRIKWELTTPFGRKRRFGFVTKQNFGAISPQAANFRVSSTSSDCCLRAALDMHYWCKANPQYDAKVLLTVHDSVYVECPIEHADTVQEILEIVMEAAPKSKGLTYVPFTVDAHQAYRWGQH